jgi:outer membrane lipoprotein-sorting protein
MKKYVILISLGVVLILAAVTGVLLFKGKSDPKETASEALQKLNAAQSFRYTFVQHEINGAQEKLLADLSGEKSGNDIGLKGKVAGNDVEMVCLGDDFFNRDLLNQKWVRYPGIAGTVIQQLFPVEFNPSTIVELDETDEVVLHNEEVINEKKCWVYQITPKVAADSINKEWKNFAATLYVDKSSHNVVRTVLTADHQRKERKLRLTLDYDSIGAEITLNKP